MSCDHAEVFESTLAENAFVIGSIIRFNYQREEVKQYSGEILKIRKAENVAKKSWEQSTSLYLVIIQTEAGIKSFWECKMKQIEIL